jgi:hypothetical protein
MQVQLTNRHPLISITWATLAMPNLLLFAPKLSTFACLLFHLPWVLAKTALLLLPHLIPLIFQGLQSLALGHSAFSLCSIEMLLSFCSFLHLSIQGF